MLPFKAEAAVKGSSPIRLIPCGQDTSGEYRAGAGEGQSYSDYSHLAPSAREELCLVIALAKGSFK